MMPQASLLYTLVVVVDARCGWGWLKRRMKACSKVVGYDTISEQFIVPLMT